MPRGEAPCPSGTLERRNPTGGVGLIGTRDAFGRVSAPERSDPDGLEIRIDFERGHGGELAAANSKVG